MLIINFLKIFDKFLNSYAKARIKLVFTRSKHILMLFERTCAKKHGSSGSISIFITSLCQIIPTTFACGARLLLSGEVRRTYIHYLF